MGAPGKHLLPVRALRGARREAGRSGLAASDRRGRDQGFPSPGVRDRRGCGKISLMERPSRRIVDLSHTIESGMTTYPGLPAPSVSDYWSRESTRGKYAEGTTFQIGRVDMIANTGTYLDAPFHRFAEGSDVAGLAIDRLVDLPGLAIDATSRSGRAVDAAAFAGRSLAGRAVLVRTGWDVHWRTPGYAEGHPF